MEKSILYHHRTQGKGAEGIHIRGMIEGFRHCGFTVDIINPPGIDVLQNAAPRPGPAGSDFGKNFWQYIARHSPQILFEFLEILYNFYGGRKIAAALKAKSYGFLYERYALNTFASVARAKHQGIPVILEVNDATVIERSRPLYLRTIAEQIENSVFQKADLLVTISNHFKKLIMNRYRIAEHKILVLPNGVSPERFRLDPARRFTRQQLHIDNRFILGCVGAFLPWHGLDMLVRSMADLLKKEDIFLLFIGDGPVRRSIETLADRLQVRDHIKFTGFVSPVDVPYYLDLLDIYVIPDANEHCSPMKLFEAMIMAKPVVLPSYSPLQDVMTPGENCLFFSPGDAGAMRAHILTLLDDENFRKSLGDQAKTTVCRQHTWENKARVLFSTLAERGIHA